MKLLNCLECHDILSLILNKERKCRCGKSSGKHVGLVDVEYSGPSRILHISNEDYAKARPAINTSYPWHVAFDGANIRKIDSEDSNINDSISELTSELVKTVRKFQKE